MWWTRPLCGWVCVNTGQTTQRTTEQWDIMVIIYFRYRLCCAWPAEAWQVICMEIKVDCATQLYLFSPVCMIFWLYKSPVKIRSHEIIMCNQCGILFIIFVRKFKEPEADQVSLKILLSLSHWRSFKFKLLSTASVSYRLMWFIELRHFQWPWTTSNIDFKVTPLFDAECFRNGIPLYSYNV